MRYDIGVIGAGPAGMIAALRMAKMGHEVVVIERNQPNDNAADLRSTAFLEPAISVLDQAGLWIELQPLSTPLDVMEIVDASQNPLASVAFQPSEVNTVHFGHNVMNADLRRILSEKIASTPNIVIKFGAQITALRQTESMAALRLEDGDTIKARLLIAADGRTSKLGNLLNISVDKSDYDQSALVTTIAHALPHNNVSTEVHVQGGPFTTVPIGNVDGQHASALVWLDSTARIAALRHLGADAFDVELNARSYGIRGQMRRIGPIGSFPMIIQSARKLHDHRAVLIGEAAHVVPPIGAQGLNMSLRDIETLARAVATGALENPNQLASWARLRQKDIALRKRGIDALNRVSIANFGGAESLRKYGLLALGRESMLRRAVIRKGLGL